MWNEDHLLFNLNEFNCAYVSECVGMYVTSVLERCKGRRVIPYFAVKLQNDC